MNIRQPVRGDAKPKLYHNPASYFSMIARLALAEAGIAHEEIFVDIHLRGSQQSPAYVRINPNMTVPTLVLREQVIDQSRDVLSFALARRGNGSDYETQSWLDLHYSYPIEELTFGGFLAHHALARAIIPARMAASRNRLLRLAAAHPDLAGAYNDRAAVFAERQRTFDPKTAVQLEATQRGEAIKLIDRLERRLADGRQLMIPPIYGAADVVWTVFLARMAFVGMEGEVLSRPALAQYWGAVQARPSFMMADVWTKLHVGRLIGGLFLG